MKLIIKNSLHNVIKNMTTMQNKVGFMSALVFSVLVMSSCEESLTDSQQLSSPSSININEVSATINQNNISVIAKSMMQTLNQVNPALSNDIYTVSSMQKDASMDNCDYSGLEYSEVVQFDAVTFDYELEFLDCQKTANNDRILGDLTADVIFSSESNESRYSVNLKSEIKQTNRYGVTTISHLNSYIQVNDTTSTQSFDLKVLLDGQGTFFVKSVSLLEHDNATSNWIGGHLVLTSVNEEIDVYIEKDDGLYFEFSDGSMQSISFAELNAIQ